MPNDADETLRLPAQFRKWDISRRREALREILAARGADLALIDDGMGPGGGLVDLADVMVESAVGYAGLPLAICRGLVVDGEPFDVPLVTEEPSVVAAVNYSAGIVARHGGFRTTVTAPITTGQVFLENTSSNSAQAVLAAEPEIRHLLQPLLESMEKRGGGYRGLDVEHLSETNLLRVQIHIDVRDAMGANLVNTASEQTRPLLESVTGGRCLMAILTNASDRRLATAQFSVGVSALGRSGVAGNEMARRIALAGALAQEDPTRAVTHNKGVMNGITALMLATGNDTRAVEAALHSHAGKSGRYRGITHYEVTDDQLIGVLEAPFPVGTVGGAAGIHPTSRLSLLLLGNPGSTKLARIAAAVGLAQNLAALSALTGEGIQRGHMSLHSRKAGLGDGGNRSGSGEQL